MPISYRTDPVRRVIYLEMQGAVDVAEVRDYRLRLQRDPDYSADFAWLVDARGVSHVLSRADVRRLADLMRIADHAAEKTKRAVLISEPALLQLMEVFQAYTRGDAPEYRVFHSASEAQRWLCI
jgi:hypothetical protein